MVAQLAVIPIATAVGEFALPYLIRKAGEIGLTRFIQIYGSAAAAAIGIQKTQPVDLQTEKILGMPVSHITGQGEVYDDIDYSYIDEDKENDEVPTKTTEEKLTEPTEPEPPEGPDVGADLAAEAAIHTTKKLLEDKKTKDITKQTKDLIKKQKTKFRKHQSGQYFVDIDGKEKFEIYDNSIDTGEKLPNWQVSGQDEFGDNQGRIAVIDTFNTYRDAKEYVLQLIEEQTKK